MTASTPLSDDKRPLRLFFLGESVAAGYLYAPHLTPAKVLREQWQWVNPDTPLELIDWAQTNETLSGLVHKAQQAVANEADILLIFAGNNWNLLETTAVSPYAPSLAAKQTVAQIVQEKGLLGLVEHGARQRLQKGAASMAEINALATAAGATVILVVPEVNLSDWWSRQPPVWLAGQQTAVWYRHYFAAQRQLAERAWEAAVLTAQKMIALDGHTCPTSQRILAEAHMGLGQWAQAREAAIGEVDSDQYALLGFMSAPRSTPLEQTLLRQSARQFGWTLVDLPQIFADYLPTGLPDRRLFLDYCHLTAEGMRVSMGAVTAVLCQLNGVTDERSDWQTLLKRLPPPTRSAEVDAVAQFGAAMHTAHRLIGEKQSLLRHWCAAALASSGEMAQRMLDLIRARLQSVPIVLTGTERRNQQQPIPLGIQQGWHYAYLDQALIRAIEATLVGAGHLTPAEFQQQLLAVEPAYDDLAVPDFYHGEPLARFYWEVMPMADLAERPFYRSPWPISAFCWHNNGRSSGDVTLTARAPAAGQAELWLNGTRVRRFAVGTTWRQQRLPLPAHLVRLGLNRVEVRWPYQAVLGAVTGEQMVETAVWRLQRGLSADWHPLFGELFSLRVQ